MQLFDKFKAWFKKKFEIKFFNIAKLILGILVIKNIKYKTFYLINNIYYILNLLSSYNMIKTNFINILIIKKLIFYLAKAKMLSLIWLIINF